MVIHYSPVFKHKYISSKKLGRGRTIQPYKVQAAQCSPQTIRISIKIAWEPSVEQRSHSQTPVYPRFVVNYDFSDFSAVESEPTHFRVSKNQAKNIPIGLPSSSWKHYNRPYVPMAKMSVNNFMRIGPEVPEL